MKHGVAITEFFPYRMHATIMPQWRGKYTLGDLALGAVNTGIHE